MMLLLSSADLPGLVMENTQVVGVVAAVGGERSCCSDIISARPPVAEVAKVATAVDDQPSDN